MTTICEFVIPGPAQGKGRPRVFNGRGVTPAKTRSQEGYIKLLAAQAMGGRAPHQGPVFLSVYVARKIPVGWPGWKADAADKGRIYPTGKPDFDNQIKMIADALNGVVWLDDSQVVGASFVRVWGSSEHTCVYVEAAPGVCASVKTKRDLEGAA